ncbi:MAG: molybdopterin-dependent oxidoreductase [Deltaproteobacteria bacterium]|nr:molybdopterin-dependent oxidoreductase [Deltaproteobacteria bacterium]
MAAKWIPTACSMCYVGCGIRVLVEDGVVKAIEGDPNNPQNRGSMCAKGKAGIMNLYNPNRVKVPLKRTNPRKGLHIDPGWQEVSWEEALDTIVAKLQQIRDDPKKLHIQAWELNGDAYLWLLNLGVAFGSPHVIGNASATCGKVVHPVEFFSGGGFHQQPDLHYCNYCLLVGTQFAIAARGAFNHILRDMAEARSRGMKLVVVDPVGGNAASKADEWVPIRPGTDTAFALGMLHVLLNELGIYDANYLKHKTNAAYLVGSDGRYIREPKSGKPTIYDTGDQKVKSYDDPTLIDPAISGAGEGGRPAFERLREHVAKYPPEKVEEITTIPAGTLRRLAKEFAEASRVGASIKIDGVELPYRPACVDWAKGPQGHKHGFHQSWPLKLINIVMGAVNVPGGILSTAAAGKRPHQWWPEGGTDGLLEEGGHVLPLPHPKAFPGRTPTKPIRLDLAELFPLAPHFHTLLPITAQDPERFGLSYKIEVMLHNPTNSLLGSFGDLKLVEEFYQSMSFIAGFAVEINETNLFDDIILPFPTYLERFDFLSGTNYILPHCGKDDWFWQVRQPVVEAPKETRQPQEVIMEIADRVGILGDLYQLVNHAFRLKDPHALKPGQRYSTTELVDKMARTWFGEEHGLKWFRENGVLRIPRDVDEAYIGPFLNARLPIYLEHFLDRGRELKSVVTQMGLEWDLSDYTPLSEWLPCPSYEAIRKGDYDLIAVHYKVPFVYGSFGNENPWINELCEQTHTYSILVNEDVASAKGIDDGDEVWLESPVCKVRAIAKLTQCIHPEVVGIGGHFGHWSSGMPVAQGKGVNFNSLLPTDLDHIDKISTALDHCVQVRVYKVTEATSRMNVF